MNETRKNRGGVLILLSLLVALCFSGCAAKIDVYVHNRTDTTVKTVIWAHNAERQIDYTTLSSGYYGTVSVPAGTYDIRFYKGSNTSPMGGEDGVSLVDGTHIYLNGSDGSYTYTISYE